MKRRTIIGFIFIVAALLKLATLWGILHWSWFETMSEGPGAMYLGIFILLYVGVHLVLDSYRRDHDQWLRRPIPPAEEGKRICCRANFGGDEYIYRGEAFHGARLDAVCGGIRMDLRKAVITEDEEIDIHTFMGGVELFVPDTVNVVTKSRSFIGGVGKATGRRALHGNDETNRDIKPDVPCLHIVASNFLGGVSIKNMAVLMMAVMMSAVTFGQSDSLTTDTTMWYNQTQQLDGIVVKGNLPKTRVKGDAMRTTVAGTILEKAGTVSDALSKIPSLEAQRDGAVKVTGRGDAEVYINGRRVQDVKELSRLHSDQIQHVDVVQNPGARYAASTKAVVRITLKKAQGEGISFQESAGGMYQYGHTLTNNLDVNFRSSKSHRTRSDGRVATEEGEANYRTGGLDITASLWAGRYGHSKSLQENLLLYNVGPNHYEAHSNQESKSIWKGWSPQLQVNYMVNENHSFGAFYKYDRHPSAKFRSTFYIDNFENGNYVERSESNITQEDEFKKHIFNAYYRSALPLGSSKNGKAGQLSIDLNIDGLFDDTKTPGSTTEITNPAPDQTSEGVSYGTVRAITSNTNSGNNFWATKLIFSYPVWKGNLSVGGEYSYNHRTDAYDFTATDAVPVKTTDTEINEKSSAVFAEYGRQFGKLFAQVGLRYEHLTNDYFNFGQKEDEVCRDYGDWFPTAVLSMLIGKVQLALSYRRDIERPAYSSLTSSTVYINRYTYQSGNPYLLPKYTHSLMLNAAYQWLNFTANYSHIKDATTLATEPYPGAADPLISLVRTINSQDDYSQLMLYASARPTVQWSMFNGQWTWHPKWTAYVIFQDYKSPCSNGTVITLDRPFASLGWQNDLELPHDWRLNIEAQYLPRGDYNNFRITRTAFKSSVGVQHDVNLRRLGTLNIDLRCYDLLNTNRSESIVYGLRDITSKNPARRTFLLDLTWKFNEAHSKYRGSGAGDKQKARM